MTQQAITTTDLPLKLVARGKVRDVYDSGLSEGANAGALLFVATDRISAFDIILDNVSPFHPHSTRRRRETLKERVRTGYPLQRQAAACPLDVLVFALDALHHWLPRPCHGLFRFSR